MSLSTADMNLVSEQETLLTADEREVVMDVFDALWSAGARHDVYTRKDDECAKLEAALIRYLLASRK